jgi:hypothetical protein
MDEYFRNSLEKDSEEMRRICAAVKDAGVFVVLGYSERFKGTLYIAQVCPHSCLRQERPAGSIMNDTDH